MVRTFIFLYPIPEIIDFEVKKGMNLYRCSKEFRKTYADKLNECIDKRYRQNGFEINFAVFDGSSVSDVIRLQKKDRVIEVGLDFKTHTTKKAYPDNDFILYQLNGCSIIRIAGFHLWDCVGKLAKRAYEKGLEVLVDEDLTELFAGRLKDLDFRVDKFPCYDARKDMGDYFDMFMEARKGKPWLWQNY